MEIAIEKSCRVCLLTAQRLVSVFEERGGRPISELIKEISGVTIESHDSLSKKICIECESKTLDFHEFRQLCIDSDETVRYNLMLADDGCESSENMDVISDETLKKADEDDSLVEEYFIEDVSVEQNEYLDEEVNSEYDEQYSKAEDTHIYANVQSSDEDCFDDKKNTVVIQRVDTRISTANSIVLEPSEDLAEKMRIAHFAKEQQKKHKCPHCDKFFMFPSKGMIKENTCMHSVINLHLILVNRHVLAVHKNSSQQRRDIKKNHNCNICGKAFVSQFKVRRHMVVHDTELKMGLQKNWSRNYFLCEACNKKFHTQASFDRHKLICGLLQKSLIDRPSDHEYFCVICALIFPTHDEMVEHMKSHTSSASGQPHVCIICPNVSLQINEMIRHGKYHEENVTYRCCVCQKMYPNGEEIVTHLLRHKEYKPFSCRECGRSFFDKYKLRQHLNTHDPNIAKNFVCEFCQRAFAAQDYLNCHVRRRHSDVKPFLCNFCSKSFAFIHDLNLHVSNHTGKFNFDKNLNR